MDGLTPSIMNSCNVIERGWFGLNLSTFTEFLYQTFNVTQLRTLCQHLNEYNHEYLVGNLWRIKVISYLIIIVAAIMAVPAQPKKAGAGIFSPTGPMEDYIT
jgi:ABC-type phosphate/phosphonate transport system permease subunit